MRRPAPAPPATPRWSPLRPSFASSTAITRLIIAVALAAVAVQWAHALSGFGGEATQDLFSRWV